MTTKTVSNRDLTNTSALVFIRPIDVTLNIKDVRPNTTLYVFFDGQSVNRYITPEGKSLGDLIVSDSSGKAKAVFSIPSNTFNTGAREIRVQDSPSYEFEKIVGSSSSSAVSTFYTAGVKNTFQETITEITQQIVNVENTVWIDKEVPPPVTNIPTPVVQAPEKPERPPTNVRPPIVSNPGAAVDNNSTPRAPRRVAVDSPEAVARREFQARTQGDGRPVDPLAQSFFTFGITGGCFITKIDLYFQTKDNEIPIVLEVREMVNGFPGPSLISPYARVSLNPSSVFVSNNANTPTSFVFDRPIYLKEDSEFCFVVISNSKQYNLWCSRFGEVSVETGNTIFEQPYAGSLFKSENNITWTPEQYEDIKFTMYKASFNTDVETNLIFNTDLNRLEIKGNQLHSIAGSNVIRYFSGHKHSMEIDSKISIECQEGIFNGIPSDSLSGVFNVISVIDEYTLEFSIGVNATETGPLSTPGYITAIYIDTPGTGFSSPPSVSFIGGGGTGASANAEVFEGSVFRINLTNRGTGYTSNPTVIFNGSGTGVTATATVESTFFVTTNRTAHIVRPVISNFVPEDTEIQATLKMTTGNYIGGNLNSYSLRNEQEIKLNQAIDLGVNSWIVSRENEFAKMSNNPSSVLNVLMKTNNPNVSPVIDYNVNFPALHATAFKINNQVGEDTFENSLVATPEAVIKKISLVSGGTGYVSGSNRPSVFIYGDGEGAVGLARVGGIKAIEITNGGSGYTSPPTVTISGDGTNASVSAIIRDGSVYSLIPFDSGDNYTNATITFTGGGGTGAAANVILADPTEITQIRMLNNGSGYTSQPEVVIVDPRTTNPGTGAAAVAILSKFNTERKPNGGNAHAKYISKIFSLQTPSTGSRLYASIYSPSTGGVDVYIRTSLSSSEVEHKSLTWRQMKGNAERNLSGKKGEFLDYSFLFDNLEEYDTFDLKIVLKSTNPADPPQLRNFRFIATA